MRERTLCWWKCCDGCRQQQGGQNGDDGNKDEDEDEDYDKEEEEDFHNDVG